VLALAYISAKPCTRYDIASEGGSCDECIDCLELGEKSYIFS